MVTPPLQTDGPGLTLAWRRSFVLLLGAAALGLFALRAIDPLPPGPRNGGTIVLLGVAIICLWFLADALRPWLDDSDPARHTRLRASGRALTTLIWLASGLWLLLQGTASSGGGELALRLDPGEVALFFMLVGLLLPPALVAWTEADAPARSVGPGRLVHARFTGSSAGGHLVGAGLAVFSLALLALAAQREQVGGMVERALLLIAVLAVVVAWAALGRMLIRHHRRGEDARPPR